MNIRLRFGFVTAGLCAHTALVPQASVAHGEGYSISKEQVISAAPHEIVRLASEKKLEAS